MRQVMTIPFAPSASAAEISPSRVPSPWRIDRNSSASNTSTQSEEPISGSSCAWFSAEGCGLSPGGIALTRWWARPSASSRISIVSVPSVQSLV